jgi:lipid-A-disaccharide synthase
MRQAGCELHEDLCGFAVMWLSRALLLLPKFLALLARTDRLFRHQRPDAVVLIDFPGFNWWVARRAKARGIPVFYYGTPQLWAWASWRIRKMRKYVDHVLCKLPFEETWFRQRGCNAHFVGHPYFDELTERKLNEDFLSRFDPSRPLVTLLPGSRVQEVTGNLPWLLRAAEIVSRQVPEVRLCVASFNEQQAELARRAARASDARIDVYVHRTPELIHAATCCMACSGSVSLELLFHRKPAVIIYWISRWAHEIQRVFRRVRFITLVNLLATNHIFRTSRTDDYDPDAVGAAHVPFPEYLTSEDKSEAIAKHVVRWLTDPSELRACRDKLDVICRSVAHDGASRRTAIYILQQLRLERNRPVRALTTDCLS